MSTGTHVTYVWHVTSLTTAATAREYEGEWAELKLEDWIGEVELRVTADNRVNSSQTSIVFTVSPSPIATAHPASGYS